MQLIVKLLLLQFFSPKIQGQLRHALQAAGVLMASRGYGTAPDWELYVGLIMVFMGFLGSWLAPEKKA